MCEIQPALGQYSLRTLESSPETSRGSAKIACCSQDYWHNSRVIKFPVNTDSSSPLTHIKPTFFLGFKAAPPQRPHLKCGKRFVLISVIGFGRRDKHFKWVTGNPVSECMVAQLSVLHIAISHTDMIFERKACEVRWVWTRWSGVRRRVRLHSFPLSLFSFVYYHYHRVQFSL